MVFDAPKGFFIKDAEKKLVDVWDYVQTGLVYSSPHAIFVSFRLRDNAAQIICEDLAILMNKISSFIMRNIAGVKNHTSAILGVDIELAKKVFKDPKIGGNNTAQTIEKTKGIYSSSGAHLWFHIKSDNK